MFLYIKDAGEECDSLGDSHYLFQGFCWAAASPSLRTQSGAKPQPHAAARYSPSAVKAHRASWKPLIADAA